MNEWARARTQRTVSARCHVDKYDCVFIHIYIYVVYFKRRPASCVWYDIWYTYVYIYFVFVVKSHTFWCEIASRIHTKIIASSFKYIPSRSTITAVNVVFLLLSPVFLFILIPCVSRTLCAPYKASAHEREKCATKEQVLRIEMIASEWMQCECNW